MGTLCGNGRGPHTPPCIGTHCVPRRCRMKSLSTKCVKVLGQTPITLRTLAIGWIIASTQMACVAASDPATTGDVIGSENTGSIETKIYGGERDNDAEEVGNLSWGHQAVSLFHGPLLCRCPDLINEGPARR